MGRQYDAYEKANKQLEGILKGINDYLEKKRLEFPKFFFFSNEDLIFFLSRDKDPISLEPFLHKCFEGIAKLIIKEDLVKSIKGIRSSQDETIQFCNDVKLFTEIEAKFVNRPVEDWLRDMESEISITLHKQFENGIKPDFSGDLLPQISQLIAKLNWTQIVEKSISEKSLPKCLSLYETKIKQLVDKILSKDEKITKIKLQEISNMIILELHNKDIIEQLISLDIKDLNLFEWQSELRYYLSNSTALCKSLNCEREYGFDFLPDFSRLVITPLTSRCYRTLMNSLNIFCGGASQGPTCIGKTETVKDLGKAVGKTCLVFSGSGALQVDSFSRLFKGIASSGMWVCIDEFNKIQLEVLSVVAQYVQAVLSSLKSNMNTVNLQESTTFLNSQCGIFITFNPVLNSHISMPENLKVLFRSIIMTTPDKSLIAQTILASKGFENYKSLGSSLSIVFETAFLQLGSKKEYYDFSMRSLKQVLKTCDKTTNANIDEKLILRKCLEDFYIPRLSQNDKKIFEGILADQFAVKSNSNTEEIINQELDRGLQIGLKLYNLVNTPIFMSKLVQMNELVKARPGIILLGNYFSGKSSLLNVLVVGQCIENILKSGYEDVVLKIEEQLSLPENTERLTTEELFAAYIKKFTKMIEDSSQRIISINKLAPNSMSLTNLYGEFDTKQNVWKEGILPVIIRNASGQDKNKSNWIIFDGLIDKSWCDGLYSALDESRRLCLSNGESLILSNNISFIFETDSLQNATAAIISRCGICTMSNTDLTWESVYDAWVETLPPVYQTHGYYDLFCALRKELLNPIMASLFGSDNHYNKIVENCTSQWAVKCFTKVLESLIFEDNTREELHRQHKEQQQKQARREAYMKLEGTEPVEESPMTKRNAAILTIKKVLEIAGLYLEALVWGLGCHINENQRPAVYKLMLDKFLKLRGSGEAALEYMKDAETVYPAKGTALDMIYFDTKNSMWTSFNDYLKQENQDSLNDSLIIPNEETGRFIWISKKLLQHNENLILIGNSDSGKSTILNYAINKTQDQARNLKKLTQFTGKTNADQVYEIIDSCYEKRVKNIYAPKGFANRFIFSIDDLNLPSNTNKVDLNPLELLRSLIAHNGLYDYSTLKFREFIKFQFVSTSHISHKISPRLTKYCTLVNLQQLSENGLRVVFTSFIEQGFSKYDNLFNRYVADLVNLTLQVYQNVQKTFFAIPSKSHYKFSISKVFEIIKGLTSVPKSAYDKFSEDLQKQAVLYKLWLHENLRTFGDSLSDVNDRAKFEEILKNISENSKHVADWSVIAPNPKDILFTNIFDHEYSEQTISTCIPKIRSSLEEYQRQHKTEINIMLCETAIQQICAIARLFGVCRNHGLFVGIGGIGRTKLAKIACFLLGLNTYMPGAHRQFGKTEWRENVKQLFRVVGNDKRETVFLCSDQVISGDNEVDNTFIEDLNSMLSGIEVSELFNHKEKEELLSDRKFKNYDEFMRKAREKLRIMICMNSLSSPLRK